MEYDAILYIQQQINEHDRKDARKSPVSYDVGYTKSINYDDPKLYSAFSFGRLVQSSIERMGSGFSCEVTDFGKWVVVKMGHHDIITGRTSTKTYLIVFQDKGDGIVLSTNNRWRSISGVDQAVSYIKSSAQSLKSSNSSRI